MDYRQARRDVHSQLDRVEAAFRGRLASLGTRGGLDDDARVRALMGELKATTEQLADAIGRENPKIAEKRGRYDVEFSIV